MECNQRRSGVGACDEVVLILLHCCATRTVPFFWVSNLDSSLQHRTKGPRSVERYALHSLWEKRGGNRDECIENRTKGQRDMCIHYEG